MSATTDDALNATVVEGTDGGQGDVELKGSSAIYITHEARPLHLVQTGPTPPLPWSSSPFESVTPLNTPASTPTTSHQGHSNAPASRIHSAPANEFLLVANGATHSNSYTSPLDPYPLEMRRRHVGITNGEIEQLRILNKEHISTPPPPPRPLPVSPSGHLNREWYETAQHRAMHHEPVGVAGPRQNPASRYRQSKSTGYGTDYRRFGRQQHGNTSQMGGNAWAGPQRFSMQPARSHESVRRHARSNRQPDDLQRYPYAQSLAYHPPDMSFNGPYGSSMSAYGNRPQPRMTPYSDPIAMNSNPYWGQPVPNELYPGSYIPNGVPAGYQSHPYGQSYTQYCHIPAQQLPSGLAIYGHGPDTNSSSQARYQEPYPADPFGQLSPYAAETTQRRRPDGFPPQRQVQYLPRTMNTHQHRGNRGDSFTSQRPMGDRSSRVVSIGEKRKRATVPDVVPISSASSDKEVSESEEGPSGDSIMTPAQGSALQPPYPYPETRLQVVNVNDESPGLYVLFNANPFLYNSTDSVMSTGASIKNKGGGAELVSTFLNPFSSVLRPHVRLPGTLLHGQITECIWES